ncbi:MAG TPA: prolipoprotein diacylglyceryl transferase [Abditibacteriaceae bacterium]|jgi:phosphatidylglycerol:prolipoprotein diacylglycerol transferase
MLPILFTIPPLPGALFLPLLLTTFVVAALFALRSATQLRAVPSGSAEYSDVQAAVTFPLFVAAFLSVLLWVWSRNPIKLHSYGLFLILGFAVAVWNACREAKRRGRDYNIILDLSIPLLLASVIMCRIVYIALDPGQFDSIGQMVRLWDGGLSFHGSLVAAPAVVWFYAWRNKISFGELADIIAPSVFLGYAVARLGCFFNGCCYGAVCNLPWGVQFHAEGRPAGELTPPSHPTQLYSSLLSLLFFGLMQRAKTSTFFNRFAGQLSLLFFALYAVERAIVEIYRNGATAVPMIAGIPWFTQAQFISVVMLLAVAVIWIVLARRAEYSKGQGSVPTLSSNPPNVSSR